MSEIFDVLCGVLKNKIDDIDRLGAKYRHLSNQEIAKKLNGGHGIKLMEELSMFKVLFDRHRSDR